MSGEREPTHPNFNNGTSRAASPVTSCVAPLKQVSLQDIEDLIDQGKRQEAIDKAVQYFKIDTSNAKSVTYDPTLSGDGQTTPQKAITIGPSAFSSPGWLGSTIGHEAEIHVNEQIVKGTLYRRKEGRNLNEVQAYDYEISSANRYGTNQADLAELRTRRDQHYQPLDAEDKKLADNKVYVLKPWWESIIP